MERLQSRRLEPCEQHVGDVGSAHQDTEGQHHAAQRNPGEQDASRDPAKGGGDHTEGPIHHPELLGAEPETSRLRSVHEKWRDHPHQQGFSEAVCERKRHHHPRAREAEEGAQRFHVVAPPSALLDMLRAVGVRARESSGMVGGEQNRDRRQQVKRARPTRGGSFRLTPAPGQRHQHAGAENHRQAHARRAEAGKKCLLLGVECQQVESVVWHVVPSGRQPHQSQQQDHRHHRMREIVEGQPADHHQPRHDAAHPENPPPLGGNAVHHGPPEKEQREGQHHQARRPDDIIAGPERFEQDGRDGHHHHLRDALQEGLRGNKEPRGSVRGGAAGHGRFSGRGLHAKASTALPFL